MKKTGTVRVSERSASVAVGSPSRQSGIDVAALYIDMLCERFKDRGIKTSVRSGAEAQKNKEGAKRRLIGLYTERAGVSASDAKYNTQNIGGRSCMSSDDFANYYRDLRDYKMPRFYSRAESEYEEADAKALADGVQESGKPPKKAIWLAVIGHAGSKIKEIPSHLNREEFERFAENWFEFKKGETVAEGEKKKIPLGVISTILVFAISLLLIVCSSVMVSRASWEVSSLEDKIDSLDYQIKDLEGKLEVKNNMLDIKNIAVKEYGMISADYASSRYVDIKEDEKIEGVEADGKKESWLSEILHAIGFGD
ncbi:MAG: hypothetical protein ACI3X1_03885 [Eubacteriales bacterium]